MEKVRSSTYLVVTNIRFLFSDDWSIVIWWHYQWAFFVLLNKMCKTMLGERIYLATGVWCSPTRVHSLEETTFMENACVALRCSLVKFLDTISYMIQNSASLQLRYKICQKNICDWIFEPKMFHTKTAQSATIFTHKTSVNAVSKVESEVNV